ncbi:MAG: hypothetical protein ABI818_14690, partial [Acidobacteriota bacterium]
MNTKRLRASTRVAVLLAGAALAPAGASAQVATARQPSPRDFGTELGCGVNVASAQPRATIHIAPG